MTDAFDDDAKNFFPKDKGLFHEHTARSCLRS